MQIWFLQSLGLGDTDMQPALVIFAVKAGEIALCATLGPEAHDSPGSMCSLLFSLLVTAGLLRHLLLLARQLLLCVLPGSLNATVHHEGKVMGACQWSWAGLESIIMRAIRTSPCTAKPRHADSQCLLTVLQAPP